MSTHKNINRICVVVTVLAVICTILFMNGKRLGLTSVYDEDSEAYEDSTYFTANDQKGDWDESSATFITLDGDECKISGNGAYSYDGGVVISGGGYYVISGSLEDGNIVVDAYESSKVYIKLKGVDIYCSDDACLRIDQADKVFLTLDADSDNSFESGEEYSDEALADGTGGAIFAHDDLTINGDGSLTITANYKHGIDANDDLIITGGYIAVYAPKDGLHVNDSIRIKNADIVVEAEDDGIVTSKEGGYLYMESGSLDITGSDDGIHATGDVIIDGGEIDITAGDDGIHSDTNVTVNDGYINIPQCYEGIEAITIDITGGEIKIYPSDDGLNANGGSGDMFGMGGQNDMGGMQGGMGGPNGDFDPNNMTGDEQTSDKQTSDEQTSHKQTGDATQAAFAQDSNTAGTTQEDSTQTDPVQDNNDANMLSNTASDTSDAASENTSDTSSEDEETYINISGGKLTIINENGQDADGLDSNGSIYISGGEIYVSLSGNGTNNAIDYGSENSGICEINGGTVIACGGNGMVEEISDTSTQCSIMYNMSEVGDADTEIRLTDASGSEIISYEVPCSYSSIVISTPDIKQNETYTLTMGTTTEEITTEEIAGAYGEAVVSTMGGGMGGMQGGMQNDNMQNGGMPDGNMQGGMRGGRGFDQNNTSDQNSQPGQDMNNQNVSTEDTTEDDTTTYSSLKEVTNEEWMWLGAAAGVLILGLIIAGIYKRW